MKTWFSLNNEARLMEIVEILESLWRLYSNENGDFQVGFQGRRRIRDRWVGGTGLAEGGVRRGTPPRGTGLELHSLPRRHVCIGTADLKSYALPPTRKHWPNHWICIVLIFGRSSSCRWLSPPLFYKKEGGNHLSFLLFVLFL